MTSSALASPSAGWSDWVRSGRWQDIAETDMPVLPTRAQEMFLLAMDPDVAPNRLIELVSRDPVLATRVLRLANSAFSASAVEITTIPEAVMRVGTALVRNVMSSTCLKALAGDTRLYGRPGQQCVEHCIGTAYLASLVAERTGEPPAEAFLYGLLHDIGKLLLLKLAREAARYGLAAPDDAELAAIVTEQHTLAGWFLVDRWSLPARLHDPIVWHHDPEMATDRPQAAAVAYVANRLARRYGVAGEHEEFDPLGDPIFASLKIDSHALTALDSRAPALLDTARTTTV